MSEYPTIKATDIRVGDMIQKATHVRIEKVSDQTIQGVDSRGSHVSITIGENDVVELVHRPAPKLPTEPGSLIWIKAFDGVALEDPILAMLDGENLWRTSITLADRTTWAAPDQIIAWSPATVTKATSTTDMDSL